MHREGSVMKRILGLLLLLCVVAPSIASAAAAFPQELQG